MPPSTTDTRISAHIESFTRELTELVKQAAFESIQEALNGIAPGGRARKVGRRRSTKTAGRAVRGPRRSGRRSPEQVEAMGQKVLAHIRANEGQRLEQIGVALKMPTKDLKRPISNLLEAKMLRTRGQKRGTRYFMGRRKSRGRAA